MRVKKLNEQIVKLLAVETDTDKLVMVSEPAKWSVIINDNNTYTINNYGGFLLNNINKHDFISHKNSGKTSLENLNIIDCINYMGVYTFCYKYKSIETYTKFNTKFR